MITKEQREEVKELHNMVMQYLSEHTNVCPGSATKDEIRAFVRIFMRPTCKYNRKVSSYNLKHVAERVIGTLFYNGNVAYVSNDAFKDVMNESPFKELYHPKPIYKDSNNEVYQWRLAYGADYWFALCDINF